MDESKQQKPVDRYAEIQNFHYVPNYTEFRP